MKIKINSKILRILGIVLISASLMAGGLIFFTKITRAQELIPPYQYEIIEKSIDPILEPSQPGMLTIKLRNTGTEAWPAYQLYLNSVFFNGSNDRPSYFATSNWIDKTTVLFDNPENQETIRPRGVVTFTIPIQAVTRKAIYQEGFKLHIGQTIAPGDPIKWLIQVGNELSYQSIAGKQIQMWLADQRLWAIENNVVILDTPISSGKPGYNTPKGKYKILNHIPTAYSNKYHLFMDNWMALSSERWGFTGMGLHSLPHVKVKQGNRVEGEIKNGRLYTNGKLYEAYTHLGRPVSHGCVRVGIEVGKILYDWAPNGTPVTVA